MTRRKYNRSDLTLGGGNPIVADSNGQTTSGLSVLQERAKQFYLNKKFAGYTYAQNLAQANIKADSLSNTLDTDGRFASFKLDQDARNAQLQCFEVFPQAYRSSYHPLAQLHTEGYRLMLKSLDYTEKYPEEHVGPTKLGIENAADRLTEIERYKLTVYVIASLTEAGRTLSHWEKGQLHRVHHDLIVSSAIDAISVANKNDP